MIDKLTPRSLQTDKSIRSVGPTEMLDALNITVTGNEDGGDGVLKNIKGNQSVPAIHNNGSPLINMPLGENIVIGSTEDETLGVVYFYVFNSLGSHGVYAYSESTKTYRLIFSDPSLNFTRNGFVKGDVVRVARRQEDVAVNIVPDPVNPFEEDEIVGCTDPAATNYNSTATIDDGSCEYVPEPIPGCTDPLAVNYNALATEDDGSCYFEEPFPGCTDPLATNYLSIANIDDGSCEYEPVLPDFTDNLCDYPSIIGPDGNITVQSFEAGWVSTNNLLGAGEITQAGAANLFPDYNGDNVWNYADLQTLLIDIIATDSLPISCTIDDGDDDGDDDGGDDGSGGGPDGDSGGEGFGPEGELPPRPINLSNLIGVPVLPSKDKEQSDTKKADGSNDGSGGGSTTDDSSKKKDVVKVKYKTKK